jgi:hypothetical protein
MSRPEWVDPVRKDDARTVRTLLERRPPAFKLTDTVRAAPCLTDAIVVYRRPSACAHVASPVCKRSLPTRAQLTCCAGCKWPAPVVWHS